MDTTRRDVAGGMAGITLANGRVLSAADLDRAMAPEGAPREIIPIWPGRPPGLAHGLHEAVLERSTPPALRDRAVVHVTRPVMIVFRPERPNGAGVLITPGGAYVRVVLDKEGFETAERLNAAGVTAFVMPYRLPGDGHAAGPNAPLQDVQRAMRVMRARASEFNVDPARVGIMGFSAGGHVAGSLTFRFDASVYSRIDAADDQPARPAFSMLIYPVASMGAFAHAGSREELLGRAPSAEQIRAYSLESMVRPDAPPCFFALAEDDDTVPPENAFLVHQALRAQHVPSELHAFEKGGHGFGIRFTVGKPTALWPDLVLNWMRAHGAF
ncbi:MAG TPA: alpha/beta hydrolase [Caulobacterales bacterium]|nr:alpha/beta hydrolase [Caulobacterales bacterium]